MWNVSRFFTSDPIKNSHFFTHSGIADVIDTEIPYVNDFVLQDFVPLETLPDGDIEQVAVHFDLQSGKLPKKATIRGSVAYLPSLTGRCVLVQQSPGASLVSFRAATAFICMSAGILAYRTRTAVVLALLRCYWIPEKDRTTAGRVCDTNFAT